MAWLSRLAGLVCPACGAAQSYLPAALTMRKWSRVAPWRAVSCVSCGRPVRVAGDANAQTMVRLGIAAGAALSFVILGVAGLVVMLPLAAIVPYRALGMELAHES